MVIPFWIMTNPYYKKWWFVNQLEKWWFDFQGEYLNTSLQRVASGRASCTVFYSLRQVTRITRNVAELFQNRLPRHGTCNLPFRRGKVFSFSFSRKLCRLSSSDKQKLLGSTPTVFSTILTKRKSANQRGAPCAGNSMLKFRDFDWVFWPFGGENRGCLCCIQPPVCQIRQDFPWFTCSVLFFMNFLIQPPNMYGMSADFFGLRNVPWIV